MARRSEIAVSRGEGGSPPAGGDAPAWVPEGHCALPGPDRARRLAEFDALFAVSLRQVERLDPRLLRFRLVGDAATGTQARDLAARESACCSFFAFHLETDGEELVVDVRVPAGRVDVLDGLERHARRHAARRTP